MHKPGWRLANCLNMRKGGVIGQGHQDVAPFRPATKTVLHQADGTTVVIHPDGSKERRC